MVVQKTGNDKQLEVCAEFSEKLPVLVIAFLQESLNRLNMVKRDIMIYIIALGVNDVTHVLGGKIELGDVCDVDLDDYANNKPTFAGFYAGIIAKYKQIQPNAKFFLMTMPKGDEEEKRSELYDRHAELIYKISEMFKNCYVLDFRKYAPVYDEEFKRNFFLGEHMNAAGYRITALMVESYIDYIIRNNPNDFRQIEFVGTAYHNGNEKWS